MTNSISAIALNHDTVALGIALIVFIFVIICILIFLALR